mgnify:CR=1 FL=1
MTSKDKLAPFVEMEVVRLKNGEKFFTNQYIATEVPYTINVNEKEIATLLCTPLDLKEMAYGFLFTSGFIKAVDDIISYQLDSQKWLADFQSKKDIDPELLQKRLFTSGCGRGVMYASVFEIAYRRQIESNLTITVDNITYIAKWLHKASILHERTHGVHTAALSINGKEPKICFDDVGRHNAVDKVIGKALLDGVDFSKAILISSGRTSSEILHKARSCSIAINISRGALTHQTILKAKEMGITVVGFAKGRNFTIYSHEHRIKF